MKHSFLIGLMAVGLISWSTNIAQAQALVLTKSVDLPRHATVTMIQSTEKTKATAQDLLSSIRQFFSNTFGRSLPTSAVGQSTTHNQLGWDHRNAVDVGLHPDSKEGRALIGYLQSAGIPFLAFRAAIPGVATGPHIHIGSPSHRIT